jgi:adenylate kinase
MNTASLNFYVEHNINVLLVGMHGVGKTSIVKEVFENNNLKWRYFSAATMDPWVDFIGVPRVSNEGGVEHLDLIRPLEFANDDVEAIFIDEFNRAPKKVRNAIMELLQFKSINGHQFKNLRLIWAAINPEDDEDTYDVEKLDPAQKDRFHVTIEVPYRPSQSFFTKKYGKVFSQSATNWWSNLTDETKQEVSPRRLDYALEIYKLGGNLRDVLPVKANVKALLDELENGPFKERVEKAFANKDDDQLKELVSSVDGFLRIFKLVGNSNKRVSRIIPLLDKETLASCMKNAKVRRFVFSHFNKYKDILSEIAPNTNKSIQKEIEKRINAEEQKNNMDSVTPIKGKGKNYNPDWKEPTTDMCNTYERLEYMRRFLKYLKRRSDSDILNPKQVKDHLELIRIFIKRSQVTTADEFRTSIPKMIKTLEEDWKSSGCGQNFYKACSQRLDDIFTQMSEWQWKVFK